MRLGLVGHEYLLHGSRCNPRSPDARASRAVGASLIAAMLARVNAEAIETELLATREGRFQVLRAGRGHAPLAIVLHGFPDHPPTFAPVIRAIAAAGFEVVAPWMRGYAPSVATGPYDADQLARDALAIGAALRADAPVYLIGHDWGALATYAACALAPARIRAAVAIAIPHPMAFLRALVTTTQLVRSWYILALQLPGAERAVSARDLAFVDWLWRRWSPGLVLAPDDRAALHATLAASMPAPVDYYRAMIRGARHGVRGPLTEKIRVPLLQLQGERDGCVSPSACRGQARFFAGDFRADVIAGVGHFMQVEDPAAVASRVIAWLRAHR
jgi:pimeloyl-ACP methyl ester carboxylesterase